MAKPKSENESKIQTPNSEPLAQSKNSENNQTKKQPLDRETFSVRDFTDATNQSKPVLSEGKAYIPKVELRTEVRVPLRRCDYQKPILARVYPFTLGSEEDTLTYEFAGQILLYVRYWRRFKQWPDHRATEAAYIELRRLLTEYGYSDFDRCSLRDIVDLLAEGNVKAETQGLLEARLIEKGYTTCLPSKECLSHFDGRSVDDVTELIANANKVTSESQTYNINAPDFSVRPKNPTEAEQNDLQPDSVTDSQEPEGKAGQGSEGKAPCTKQATGETEKTKTGPARDQVFICYSHKDKRWFHDLHTHLKPLKRKGSVTVWSDEHIPPGAEWFEQIKKALASTKVAVLLVTPNFLASDFIHEHELTPLLKEAEKGDVRIIWIPVRACSYKETTLKDYQAATGLDKPLASMKKADRDKAWVRICDEIKEACSR